MLLSSRRSSSGQTTSYSTKLKHNSYRNQFSALLLQVTAYIAACGQALLSDPRAASAAAKAPRRQTGSAAANGGTTSFRDFKQLGEVAAAGQLVSIESLQTAARSLAAKVGLLDWQAIVVLLSPQYL